MRSFTNTPQFPHQYLVFVMPHVAITRLPRMKCYLYPKNIDWQQFIIIQTITNEKTSTYAKSTT